MDMQYTLCVWSIAPLECNTGNFFDIRKYLGKKRAGCYACSGKRGFAESLPNSYLVPTNHATNFVP